MSDTQEIRVPDIGDFEQVPVIEVLVAAGDWLESDQSLVTLESDKATMDVSAPAAGRLVELKVSEGDTVSEGDLIGLLETETDVGSPDGKEDDADSGEDEDEAQAEASQPENTLPDSQARPDRTPASELDTSSQDSSVPPVPFDGMDKDPASLPHASPSVRKLAREMGVDLSNVQG